MTGGLTALAAARTAASTRGRTNRDDCTAFPVEIPPPDGGWTPIGRLCDLGRNVRIRRDCVFVGLLMGVSRDVPLTVYLLDQVDFAALLKLQRRLVYETSGTRDAAILLL